MSNGFRLIGWLLDHHTRGHFGVNRAEVGIVSGLGESERKLFIGVQNFGFEEAVCADYSMRNVVVIDPRDRGSGRNGKRSWTETEIIDLHLGGCGLLGIRRKLWRCCKHRGNHKYCDGK